VSFEGKAAVVTGGAKGIGRAVAELLTERGARVCVVDVDDSAVPPGGASVRADVSSADDCARAVAAAADAFGRLDVLVNAAGIQRYGTVVDTPEETWDEVIGVNLKGAFLMAKHAIPRIETGAVVNVASVQAMAAQRGVAAYSASKGGLVALTRAMAVDHAPGIRVNAVCPGSVDTPMLRWAAETFGGDDIEGTLRSWGEMHPMGRVASAREVAEAIAWLASDAASFVTGSALLIDGGLLSKIAGTRHGETLAGRSQATSRPAKVSHDVARRPIARSRYRRHRSQPRRRKVPSASGRYRGRGVRNAHRQERFSS
jgi:NAD(P)-dependent dehydrogenase (short-subunit alcohol dehydrogenase family)